MDDRAKKVSAVARATADVAKALVAIVGLAGIILWEIAKSKNY